MTEHEHTKTDGLGDMPLANASTLPDAAWRAPPRSERMAANKIECNACPVLCQITEGKPGACDRYANQGGVLVRVDPVLLLARARRRPAWHWRWPGACRPGRRSWCVRVRSSRALPIGARENP